MKVAIVSTYFWPSGGDAKFAEYTYAKALQNAGHEVVVLCSDEFRDGTKVNRPYTDEFEGIPIKRFKAYANLSEFAKIWFPRLQNNFDIVHCIGYRHPFNFW